MRAFKQISKAGLMGEKDEVVFPQGSDSYLEECQGEEQFLNKKVFISINGAVEIHLTV